MSVDSPGNAKKIFLTALEFACKDEREAYLSDACGSDQDLRQRVDALILAHESPESLLNSNAPSLVSDQVSLTQDFQSVDRDGMLDLQELENAITDKTILIVRWMRSRRSSVCPRGRPR